MLDKVRSLTPPGELDNPTSLFWYAFLSRLPLDIRFSCVPFVGVETLADVARRADAQFRARPRPAAPLQVCSVPRESVEHDVEDELHAAKTRAGSLPQPPQVCYYHATFGRRALKCRRPCRWSTAQGNSRGRD